MRSATFSASHSLSRWSGKFQSSQSHLSIVTTAVCHSSGVKPASLMFSFTASCLICKAVTLSELSSPEHGPGLSGHHLDTSFAGHFVPLETMASTQRVPAELSEGRHSAPNSASGVSVALKERQPGCGSQKCLKAGRGKGELGRSERVAWTYIYYQM